MAGVLSFTSPCTLPLLPGYVSYLSGLSGPFGEGTTLPRAARRRVLAGAGLFVLGFSAVFTALGASATALGLALTQNLRVINLVGGALIVVMGPAMAGALQLPVLHRQLRVDLTRFGRGPASALPLGVAFAFGWTPCVGPVLAGVLATAAGSATVGRGAALLLAYSLGLGAPFLLLAVGLARGRARPGWLRRHARRIEVGGGMLLAIMGTAVMSGGWTELMSAVLAAYARVGWPPL